MRFYLDEGESDKTADLARRYGLDTTCSHERRQDGALDDVQLAYSAGEGRVMVTRNYSDFHHFTAAFQAEGRPHAGVLFLPPSLPSEHFDGITRSMALYDHEHPRGLDPYGIDYLRHPGDWRPPPVEFTAFDRLVWETVTTHAPLPPHLAERERALQERVRAEGRGDDELARGQRLLELSQEEEPELHAAVMARVWASMFAHGALALGAMFDEASNRWAPPQGWTDEHLQTAVARWIAGYLQKHVRGSP